MKKLVFGLIATVMISMFSFGKNQNNVDAFGNPLNYKINLIQNNQKNSVWCGNVYLEVSIGIATIGTSINMCCAYSVYWQCWQVPKPNTYTMEFPIKEFGTKIEKELLTTESKEMTISKSDILEIEKSSYSVKTGVYDIKENQNGKYIDIILEKV